MLIPGKLYKLRFLFVHDPDAEEYTTLEPLGEQPPNLKEWVKVTPETIMMFLGAKLDNHGLGGMIIYVLVGDKICQWWTHAPDKDFFEAT